MPRSRRASGRTVAGSTAAAPRGGGPGRPGETCARCVHEPLPNSRPVAVGLAASDEFGGDVLDDAGEQGVLVGGVPVNRHRVAVRACPSRRIVSASTPSASDDRDAAVRIGSRVSPVRFRTISCSPRSPSDSQPLACSRSSNRATAARVGPPSVSRQELRDALAHDLAHGGSDLGAGRPRTRPGWNVEQVHRTDGRPAPEVQRPGHPAPSTPPTSALPRRSLTAANCTCCQMRAGSRYGRKVRTYSPCWPPTPRPSAPPLPELPRTPDTSRCVFGLSEGRTACTT